MKRIIVILVLVLVGSFYLVTNGNELANDYYEAINKDFFSKDYLGEEEYIYNNFTKAQDESNKVRDGIVDDIISGEIVINDSNEFKKLYNNVLDINTRNRVSISPLDGYIDSIMNSNNINELIKNAIIVEKELGIDIFTRMVVDKDFLGINRSVVLYLYPVTFAFGSSADYYVDEDYMAYKAYIKRAIINLLEKYGMSKSEARLVSSEVISFYTEISNSTKLLDSYEDVTEYYNIVDLEYLSNIYSKFDVSKYMNDNGIKTYEYSLVDEGQYKKINEYLTDEYVLIWKKVILVKILSSYADYLDMEYREIVVDLNNSLTGTKGSDDINKDATSLVSNVFSSEIDKIYESKVITGDDKKYLTKMFDDIKKYFRKMLEDNNWLSKETKEKALIKLDKMQVYVGLDGVRANDYEIEVKGNSLVENIISINKSSKLNNLRRLDDNSEVRALSESEVNAYYSPMDNAVYIPSSVMFLMNENDNYYEVLGKVGMIIAHEITHGFDYNGSLFDGDGKMNNWWNDTDRVNFTKLKNNVSKYYSKIEVLDGKYIDGDKTVNENIADMGALKVITGVAMDKGATETELKVMYGAFASFWQSQATDSYAKLLLLNDIHSPNKYRVNAVLSLVDEFYKVYNIYPWNDMYISNEDRVSVW